MPIKQSIRPFYLMAVLSSRPVWGKQNFQTFFQATQSHPCLWLEYFSKPTFSVSSFLTDLRLARRSKDTLCLEPRSERRMASAETLTLLRLGLLNFPRRSRTLMFKSLICRRDSDSYFLCKSCSFQTGASWTEVCHCSFRILSLSVSFLLGVATYLSGVVQDFGLNVVSLLVHHIYLCVQLLTQRLWGKIRVIGTKNERNEMENVSHQQNKQQLLYQFCHECAATPAALLRTCRWSAWEGFFPPGTLPSVPPFPPAPAPAPLWP